MLKYLALVQARRTSVTANAPVIGRRAILACSIFVLALPVSAQAPAAKKDPSQPEPVRTSITVVGELTAETPANISVLSETELQSIPGVNLDDRLRMVPGFTLFRRSSSLVANPTTQGVSLRGIGSSGASRTLVLWDGVPVNDPFGGWVYWTHFAPDEMQRVEVLRGASTSVFGDRAMGGAIGFFSRPVEGARLQAGYEGGNRDTHAVTAGGAALFRKFAFSGFGRALTTDGYLIVPKEKRGLADEEAGVRFVSGDVRVDYLGDKNHLFVKIDLLDEERKNGTRLTRNSTQFGTLAGHYSYDDGRNDISLLGYHTREEFHASFSSVAATRNTETLTFLQTVPSEAVGAAALWRRSSTRWNTLAGADVARVEGTSTDSLFPSGKRIGGGTQLQHGIFGQFNVKTGPVDLFLGARHQFSGDETFFSPSAGASWRVGLARLRGSVYRGFRAPTLNELFREFQAGTTVTQANPALRPETLFGSEFGVDLIGESTRFGLTFFRNALDDLITNVTLTATPARTVRQRQNAADALSRGFEIEARRRWRSLEGELSYLYADSRYLTGERIPQVPRHHGAAQLIWQYHGLLASAGLRAFGSQFEDDRNQLQLRHPGFATVQFLVQQRLTSSLRAQVAVENLLDRVYIVGVPTPTVPNIGAPQLWRIGLKWDGRLRRP